MSVRPRRALPAARLDRGGRSRGLSRSALVVVGIAAGALGCSGAVNLGGERPAAQGVRSYSKALRADSPRAAYALLSDDVRRELTYEQFEVIWRRHGGERAAQVDALDEGLRGDPDIGERAQVRYRDGKTVSLTKEGGRWRLESALISRTHAGRPIDAVRILAEALARRDYDSLMRVLTSRRRNGISDQVDAVSTSLLEHLGDEVALIGPDRAELIWETESTRYRVVLRKEGQEWRVDDIHIRPKQTQ